MSEYWGLRCETCDIETEREFNHSEDWLIGIVTRWHEIKPMYDMMQSPDLWHVQLSVMGEHGSPSVFDFLNEHNLHEIVVLSEYGTKIPVKTDSEGVG